MTSLLRQIVAGPRLRHAEADLDLCYVTDNIIATSGPGASYPQVAYRNPLKDLVKFLDSKHGENWAIWEFRAEGTGYPDEDVYGRIRHYPWPDHHPPPFALVPLIMGSMRNWLKGEDAKEKDGRVVVVHCKAGKGRSGTMACSYLISEEGWTAEDAMQRFTERRMRPGFGAGISIPSQLRWVGYVDRWTKNGKLYVERPVEVLEVHVWGLRDGVKIAVEGYVDEGKTIKAFHTFNRSEREMIRGSIIKEHGLTDAALEAFGKPKKRNTTAGSGLESDAGKAATVAASPTLKENSSKSLPVSGDVVFRPSQRVALPTNEINIDFERRNETKLGGFTMVTSVAHVWFNTFFEGRGPEQGGQADDSGVFQIDWDAMDGIKGSSRKGTRMFDKLAVVWKVVDLDRKSNVVIHEPAEGEEVKQAQPADWRQRGERSEDHEKKLGMREFGPESATVSRANSMYDESQVAGTNDDSDELEAVKSHVPDENETPVGDKDVMESGNGESNPFHGSMAGIVGGMKHVSTANLPDGVPESELHDHQRSPISSLHSPKEKDMAS